VDNFDYLNYIKNNPLLNEIKINNPNDIFQVTDNGRKVIEEVYQYFMFIEKYVKTKEDLIIDESFNSGKLFNDAFYLYNCSSKHGENVILDNQANKIEDYLKKYEKVFGEDEEAMELLNNWKKQGWIK